MNTTIDEPPERPRKTGLQQIQEQLGRQMRPLRQIEEMQSELRRHYPSYNLQELARQFEPNRQIQEMLAQSAVAKHIQDIIRGSSIAAQAKRMMEQYSPKGALAGLNDSIRRAADFDSASSIAKQFAQNLRPISAHQEMLADLRRQGLAGLTAIDFTRQLAESNSAIRAIEEARKSLDRLWPTFRDVDLTRFDSSDEDKRQTEQAAESISQIAAEQESIQDAVERIIVAIHAQRKPAVQLMLWLVFRKVMDWLIAGVIGAAMGYYAPAVLGESPQAAKKAVQENARAAVGSAELLAEYRYVSARTLIIRQNPRSRSPEIGRLSFGTAVKLLKKEKNFALVMWTDKESGAEIQGWVFSRYLGKFN